MVRVIDRIKVAKQALATLEELLDIEDVSLIISDAAIKRLNILLRPFGRLLGTI